MTDSSFLIFLFLTVFAFIVIAILIILVMNVRKLFVELASSKTRGFLVDLETRLQAGQRSESKGLREELGAAVQMNRKELGEGLSLFQKAMQARMDSFASSQAQGNERLVRSLAELSEKTVISLNEARRGIGEAVAKGLGELQEKNEQKLEQMRKTVDEKLHETLETRLSASFEIVTKQLIEVQKGLAEMRSIANDVGGLKKALTNVKVRGMLGEAQLGALLEQFLAPGQFAVNTPVKPNGSERVEYAIKLPGMDRDDPVLLPIDAKFPIEDYQRLQEAYERGERAEWETAGKAFEARLTAHAVDISSKYLAVPSTTDFALMFLPFESLYGEAIRRGGLFQEIQRKHHIVIVGPTTLAAFLNSLQVGFKTLAISRQSSEVWKVLSAVRAEFGKFGDSLQTVQKNLDTASDNLSKVSHRARQMEKRLKSVDASPEAGALELLPPPYAGEEE